MASLIRDRFHYIESCTDKVNRQLARYRLTLLIIYFFHYLSWKEETLAKEIYLSLEEAPLNDIEALWGTPPPIAYHLIIMLVFLIKSGSIVCFSLKLL